MLALWQCRKERVVERPACGPPVERRTGKWRPEPGPGGLVTVVSWGGSVRALLWLHLTVVTSWWLGFLLAMRALLRFMGSCLDPRYVRVCAQCSPPVQVCMCVRVCAQCSPRSVCVSACLHSAPPGYVCVCVCACAQCSPGHYLLVGTVAELTC